MQNDKEKIKNEFRLRIKKFILDLIKFLNGLSKTSSNEVIGRQLLRSGTSVGGNYIEAQAASSKKDFLNFFQIALKSAVESQFWLELINDTNNNPQAGIELLNELKQISNILGASVLKLKGRK
jgi:four helix bundle protein